MNTKKIPPIHPGEILYEEFLKPMGISQNQLGRNLGVSPRRINEIIHGKRSVTADTALRFAAYFGNSPSFWLGLQMDYDLEVAEDTLISKIKKEVRQNTNPPHRRRIKNTVWHRWQRGSLSYWAERLSLLKSVWEKR